MQIQYRFLDLLYFILFIVCSILQSFCVNRAKACVKPKDTPPTGTKKSVTKSVRNSVTIIGHKSATVIPGSRSKVNNLGVTQPDYRSL